MKVKIEYKGYHALIKYVPKDNMYVGEVLDINDSISFHAHSFTESKEHFHDSIDDYLSMCKEYDKEPDIPEVASS